MRPAPLALLLLTGLLGACGGRGGSSDRDVNGGGPLIYPNTDLRPIGGSGRAVAVTIGLQAVEVLDGVLGSAAPRSLPLRAPRKACVSFPVAAEVKARMNDSRHDILVFDPGCGNWVARATDDGSFQAAAWEPTLPAMNPNHLLEADDWNGDGQEDVISGNSWALAALLSENGSWKPAALDVPAPRLGHMVATRLWLRLPGKGVLLQRGEFFSRVRVDSEGLAFEREPVRQQNTHRDRAPFYGFDHLTAVDLPGCEPFALGVGLFNLPDSTIKVPRRLQLVRFQDDAFTTEEIPTLAEVTTIAAIVRGSEGDVVVGVFGKDGDTDTLQVLQVSTCGRQVTKPATKAIDLAWRAVDAPAGYNSPRLERKNGTKIIAERVASGDLRFIHYDGFDVRVFDVDVGAWNITELKYNLNKERSDYSW